jgi:hypothetical protein
MVNTAGEVIGVDTANGIVPGTRSSNGYGYAILINHARELDVQCGPEPCLVRRDEVAAEPVSTTLVCAAEITPERFRLASSYPTMARTSALSRSSLIRRMASCCLSSVVVLDRRFALSELARRSCRWWRPRGPPYRAGWPESWPRRMPFAPTRQLPGRCSWCGSRFRARRAPATRWSCCRRQLRAG